MPLGVLQVAAWQLASTATQTGMLEHGAASSVLGGAGDQRDYSLILPCKGSQSAAKVDVSLVLFMSRRRWRVEALWVQPHIGASCRTMLPQCHPMSYGN